MRDLVFAVEAGVQLEPSGLAAYCSGDARGCASREDLQGSPYCGTMCLSYLRPTWMPILRRTIYLLGNRLLGQKTSKYILVK